MNRRRLLEAVILVFVGGTILVGAWLVFAPDTVPITDYLEPRLDESYVTGGAIIIGLGVLIAVVARLVWKGAGSLDRSPITTETPEAVNDPSVRDVTAPLEAVHEQISYRMANPNRAERYIAMYGRRAFHTDELPVVYVDFFDELALTARAVYATANGCDEKTAARAVSTGAWTDDRIAAAFLGWDLEEAPTFSVRERVVAWLAPRRAFERRLEHVISAIDRQAGSYLTYDGSPSDEKLSAGPPRPEHQQRPDRPPARPRTGGYQNE